MNEFVTVREVYADAKPGQIYRVLSKGKDCLIIRCRGKNLTIPFYLAKEPPEEEFVNEFEDRASRKNIEERPDQDSKEYRKPQRRR